MEWDSSYQIESKYFRADYDYENFYYCSVKKKDKLIAEYFRHNDTSFLFVKFDTSGSRLQRGLIKYCNEIFDSAVVQIPDLDKDPNGSKQVFKDTTIYDNSYRKEGIWWEKDSLGMIWKGEYKKGLREGKWREGIEVCCNETSNRTNDVLFDLLRPYITHLFVKGKEIPLYKDSTFWPKIRGNWYYHHDLKPNRMVFEKIEESNDLVFINHNKASIKKSVCNKFGFTKTESSFIKWSQKEDILAFFIEEKNVQFCVVRLDDFYMILQPVQ